MTIKLLPRFYLIIGALALLGINILGYYLVHKYNLYLSKPITIPKEVIPTPTVETNIPLPTPKPIITPKPKVIHKPINCSYIKAHADVYKGYLSQYTGQTLINLKYCLGLK